MITKPPEWDMAGDTWEKVVTVSATIGKRDWPDWSPVEMRRRVVKLQAQGAT